MPRDTPPTPPMPPAPTPALTASPDASTPSPGGRRERQPPRWGRRWWLRRSLRARLTAAATVVITLGLVAAAGLLVWRLHATAIAGLDDIARGRASEVALALDRGVPLGAALAPRDETATIIEVVDRAGHLQAATADLPANTPVFGFPAGPTGVEPAARTLTDLPVGTSSASYRVLALAAGPPTDPSTIYVGVSTAEATASLTELITDLAVGLPVLIALLAGVGWLVVGAALRPVAVLRAQTAAITAGYLHQRLALPAAHDEIHRLTATLNDLLDRLQAATERHRGFVADAAHELRSPLAALRAQLEVATRHPDHTRWERFAPDLLADLGRLTRLVDDLVRLARLDAAPQLHRGPVDLDDLVFAAIRRARAHARVPIDSRGVGAAQVLGDSDGLSRVVGNLLDNALRYATSTVSVALAASDGYAQLTVADDGPGIPAADRERVFDRFVRLDPARSHHRGGGHDPGGAGLGLAIVAELTRAHHGQVWITDNPEGPGTRVHLGLPLHQPT